ncbi:MAG: MerR family transcriptional regulator, thiopeptide resistance regulator [Pseudonocardiales bacterium]|jgi:DNA-binding transcriptional MerR regulator|nr:HTH-type transcriptional regulator hmrR [Pseudonocardiales bacterium]MDT4957326.1 MerR family transcriptional regulator, thiopeptide resistance regulator [Pseudonocardiales bacterium]MDT4971452.1 MerR family transcriptional regulator, thiopeptide resistance regulator [Pseudonocardiales bacterium]
MFTGMDERAGLLSVGSIARRAGLTSKAVRHYDRIGLFRPTLVDEAGYRWYSPAQLRQARLIAALRAVDVPLDDVRRCLTADDDATTASVLDAHHRRLESRLVRIQRDLHRIGHLRTEGLESTMASTDVTPTGTGTAEDERKLGAALFNATWDLMEKEHRTRDDDDAMLHMAHASRHHWGQVGAQVNFARGEWQCSRVYAVLRRPEPCLHHAQRVLDICQEQGLGGFDLAFAYEALARGHAINGDPDQARAFTEQALAAAEDIAEDDDRELLRSDLETIPGQTRFW